MAESHCCYEGLRVSVTQFAVIKHCVCYYPCQIHGAYSLFVIDTHVDLFLFPFVFCHCFLYFVLLIFEASYLTGE